MRYVSQLILYRFQHWKNPLAGVNDHFKSLPGKLFTLLYWVRNIGVTANLASDEKSKLAVFNYLNFFQFITGICVPLVGFFFVAHVPAMAWIMAIAPAFISLIVLILNSKHRYQEGLLTYFIFYPFLICLGYINGISLGVELSFVLYGILSVFFIRDTGYMILSIGFSMISYFVSSVMLTKYPYQLENINFIVYLINQALAIVYIFYGLYLIKSENSTFNAELQRKNVALQEQSELLVQQSEELKDLNALKSKLFSIISHDLKSPLYALRNMFTNIQVQNMPADEVKELIPDITKDLNYTVSLMENLLQWAKSQMQAETASFQHLNLEALLEDISQVFHLQAEAKKITIEKVSPGKVSAIADKHMIHLVVRNLVSNAVKFTPTGGKITIGAAQVGDHIEVYVQDAGKGLSPEAISKINAEEFYTTNGTAQEQGTGLGLILCRDFLLKNNSRLRIESRPEKGSTFSFALPLADA